MCTNMYASMYTDTRTLAQTHRHTGTQTHRHTDTQTHTHTRDDHKCGHGHETSNKYCPHDGHAAP